MPRNEIAEQIGCSISNLKRAFRGVRLGYHNKYVMNPKLVAEVCSFYEKHGKLKTQKQFPNVRVRSIVERYKQFNPRQVRWTDKQIILMAKYAGLISYSKIAEIMNRPSAHVGSVKSFYIKRFGFGASGVHGLAYWIGKEIVTEDCPLTHTNFGCPRATSKRKKSSRRGIYLWVDMENHLKEGIPVFIEEAVQTMADFQRWLFKSKNPKKKILNIINMDLAI